MDKNNREVSAAAQNTGCIREASCIDALRVYDSCSSKEYLEDLRVSLTPDKHELIEQATNVRIRSVEVVKVCLHLEPVPFNQGFYSVDMNIFMDVCLDVFSQQSPCPAIVHGACVANKRVILFGSEGNVKTFVSGSEEDPDVEASTGKVLPKAVCQISEPIGLSAKLCDRPPQGCDICSRIPSDISKLYGGEFDYGCSHSVYITVGLFLIVQLVRLVPLLVPTYDFSIPEKESAPASDGPREMFRRIEFPTDDFFPPKIADDSKETEGER